MTPLELSWNSWWVNGFFSFEIQRRKVAETSGGGGGSSANSRKLSPRGCQTFIYKSFDVIKIIASKFSFIWINPWYFKIWILRYIRNLYNFVIRDCAVIIIVKDNAVWSLRPNFTNKQFKINSLWSCFITWFLGARSYLWFKICKSIQFTEVMLFQMMIFGY